MGSECNSCKPHYDLSLSRRTRKPLMVERVYNAEHTSLEALMAMEKKEELDEKGKHFQLVVKQQEDDTEAVKYNGKVSYVKFLRGLIRIKCDSRLGFKKKSVLRLTM
ncbi:hypothetical protein ACHQM5_013100 [Ranunculus cassubicifolius]